MSDPRIHLLLPSSTHRENKGRSSVGSRLKSLSYLDDSDDVFDRPVIAPRTRTLPPRSYTIDTPYYSPEPPEPSQIEKEPPAASPATGRAASPPASREADVVDRPAGSDTTTVTPSSLYSSEPPAAAPSQKSPVLGYTRRPKTEEPTATVPEPRRPSPDRQTKVEAPSSGFLHKQQPQPSSMEAKPPGVSRVSASLPRSYQRSDSARLTSVVAPKPYPGTQPSRISSLPRVTSVSTTQFYS